MEIFQEIAGPEVVHHVMFDLFSMAKILHLCLGLRKCKRFSDISTVRRGRSFEYS